MPCLKHYFDPDFDYRNLKPTQKLDGSTDFYNIGYVQSVVIGQVLAEWKDEESEVCSDGHRQCPEKIFPKGPNTKINPEDPNQLIATKNGYVFYNADQLITVKELLNIRGDVGLTTGNIFFVGDLIVHGSVKSALEIKAYNVNVKGVIEQANIKAGGFLKCDGGIKGNSAAHIESKGSIRASFCENATLISGKNIIIDKSCMHSTVYCEGKFAVKGRLCGGPCYSDQFIYVGGQLGGGLSIPAQLIVGYSPHVLLQINKISKQIAKLRIRIENFEKDKLDGDSVTVSSMNNIEKCDVKVRFLKNKKKQLWNKLEHTHKLESCRIMCSGVVKSGVEISIGQAFLQVDEPLEDVFFYYENHEIKVGSPALKK
ncbi:FapA family protein [Maridesulfovibrio frigidus]|uniref:FapA family protein n=1 Tax=Maridesulfovibrio frigidus TaxID=340956 RepID=UPI0004E21E25|nr:FapA family protein [Maridesulfovibrio frigidus]